MRIGITGGSGFIGGHTIEACLSRGHDVVTFDRTEHPPSPYIPAVIGERCDRWLGDVRDANGLADLAAHVDAMIHLAACLGTQETILNPWPAAETNIFGGINFLQACAQYGIPCTYIAVGNHWMDNSYSITKTTIERFARMYNKERGCRINIVRAVNAYGPRQSIAPPYGSAKVRKITPSFVCRALTGAPIEVYGDGQQVSDMIAVQDVAHALVVALERASEGVIFDRPVEVGPAIHHTVQQVAEHVIAAAVTHGHLPVEIKHLPMRPGETPGARVTADTSTLEFVGMSPSFLLPLDAGIMETVSWYEKNWLPSWVEDHSGGAR